MSAAPTRGTKASRALGLLAAGLVIAACTTQATPTPSAAPPSVAPSANASAAPSPTATPEPSVRLFGEDLLIEPFDHANFTRSTTIDNTFLPLVPGTQWTWDGSAVVDGEEVTRRVITAITDLTKVIDGVTVVAAFDQDITSGALQEAELAFFAQDDDGMVWYLGEYPEEYEDGQFVEAPFWLAGLEEAYAGLKMQVNPSLGTFSYSQGWGPKVGWTDRGRVFDVGSETCVPFACYSDVVVIDEFNRDTPDAHQLKYYAPGVGNVRTGWAGAGESEQETLALTSLVHLDAAGLAALRDRALALEAHAYIVSPDVYGQTEPLVSPAS